MRGTPRRNRACLLATLLVLSTARPATALDTVGEYQIKAAYLFNFSQFIEWPDSAFADAAQPFRLCVWGDNLFGDGLLALQKRRYRERPILVEFPQDAAAAGRCQIVYLEGREGAVQDRLQQLRGGPVLTVSSVEGFAGSGGAIEFVLSGDKIRMAVNLARAREARLRISAKLLEVALRVIDSDSAGAAP